MNAPDKIAEDLREHYRQAKGLAVVPARLATALIERVSRSEERERVLREAQKKVKPMLTDERLDELLAEYQSLAPVRMRVYDALTELKQYRAALATLAPEPAHPSAERSSK